MIKVGRERERGCGPVGHASPSIYCIISSWLFFVFNLHVDHALLYHHSHLIETAASPFVHQETKSNLGATPRGTSSATKPSRAKPRLVGAHGADKDERSKAGGTYPDSPTSLRPSLSLSSGSFAPCPLSTPSIPIYCSFYSIAPYYRTTTVKGEAGQVLQHVLRSVLSA